MSSFYEDNPSAFAAAALSLDIRESLFPAGTVLGHFLSSDPEPGNDVQSTARRELDAAVVRCKAMLGEAYELGTRRKPLQVLT